MALPFATFKEQKRKLAFSWAAVVLFFINCLVEQSVNHAAFNGSRAHDSHETEISMVKVSLRFVSFLLLFSCSVVQLLGCSLGRLSMDKMMKRE